MINAHQYIQGTYRRCQPGSDAEYRCFIPTSINREFELSNRIAEHSEAAMRLIGELNAYSSIVPNVEYFLEMHVRKEAVQSSRIEGTYTDIDDAIMAEEDISPERRNDWREVSNYIDALNYSVDSLHRLPLTMRLLNGTHKMLLQGARGEGKTPGQIRTRQNWIGGATVNSAVFVPPHTDTLPDALSDLEHFWHNRSIAMPKLVRIAVTHYQFETVHPYADGNGRIGRLLIMLQLMNYGLMQKPTLYMSDFFEKNRQNYYDALMRVRTDQDLDHWLSFFLDGVIFAAQSGKDKFEKIMALRENYAGQLLKLGRRGDRANMLLKHMYKSPVVSVADAAIHLNISKPSANALVNDLVALKVLKEKTNMSRNRLFVLDAYVQIFRS